MEIFVNTVMGVAFILIVYFLPLFIAIMRKHNNTAAIAALNILLGWTFLGWVVAFVWSFTSNTKKDK